MCNPLPRTCALTPGWAGGGASEARGARLVGTDGAPRELTFDLRPLYKDNAMYQAGGDRYGARSGVLVGAQGRQS